MNQTKRTALITGVLMSWVAWFYQWRYIELEYLNNVAFGFVVIITSFLVYDLYKRGWFPQTEYIKNKDTKILKNDLQTTWSTPNTKVAYGIVLAILLYSVYTIVINWN